MELCTNAEASAAFINGIIPADVAEKAAAEASVSGSYIKAAN